MYAKNVYFCSNNLYAYKMLKIYCKNTGSYKFFKEGTTLLDMLPEFEFYKPYDILSAKVNNVSEGLKFRVFNNRDIEYLDYRSYSGRNVYCRSLCFLLCKAAQDEFPGCSIIMRRPISKGYFCRWAICASSAPLLRNRISTNHSFPAK